MTSIPSENAELFIRDLYLMYNKDNLRELFHDTPLVLSDSMEPGNKERFQLEILHEKLEDMGITSKTPISRLTPENTS